LEPLIASVAVPPGEVPADQQALLGVAGMVGAVQGEVPQRGNLAWIRFRL
jgi:hypothetical protein